MPTVRYHSQYYGYSFRVTWERRDRRTIVEPTKDVVVSVTHSSEERRRVQSAVEAVQPGNRIDDPNRYPFEGKERHRLHRDVIRSPIVLHFFESTLFRSTSSRKIRITFALRRRALSGPL